MSEKKELSAKYNPAEVEDNGTPGGPSTSASTLSRMRKSLIR